MFYIFIIVRNTLFEIKIKKIYLQIIYTTARDTKTYFSKLFKRHFNSKNERFGQKKSIFAIQMWYVTFTTFVAYCTWHTVCDISWRADSGSQLPGRLTGGHSLDYSNMSTAKPLSQFRFSNVRPPVSLNRTAIISNVQWSLLWKLESNVWPL